MTHSAVVCIQGEAPANEPHSYKRGACSAVASASKAPSIAKSGLKPTISAEARPQLKVKFEERGKAIRFIVTNPDSQDEWTPWLLADRKVGYKHHEKNVHSPENNAKNVLNAQFDALELTWECDDFRLEDKAVAEGEAFVASKAQAADGASGGGEAGVARARAKKKKGRRDGV